MWMGSGPMWKDAKLKMAPYNANIDGPGTEESKDDSLAQEAPRNEQSASDSDDPSVRSDRKG